MQIFEKSLVPSDGLSDVAFLAKSLSDENRLRIIMHLSRGKMSVSQLAEDLNLSQPLASHHLRELKRTLLVQVERRGPFIFYSLSHPEVVNVVVAINELASTLIGERKSF